MSGRAGWIAELEEYFAFNEHEQAMQEQMRHFLQAEPDAFLRSCVPGHMTASAWVLSAAGDHVLLMHHRKLDKWLQPGGHADGDTDLRAVAAREVEEETGLSAQLYSPAIFDIDIHTIPARKADPEHLHYDVRFLFRADMGQPLLQNSESHGLRWLRLEDVPQFNDSPSVTRLMEKALLLRG